MYYNETNEEKQKWTLKTFYLPILFLLFFIGQSGFGKNLCNGIGLDTILLIFFIIMYIKKLKYIPKNITITYIILILYTLIITMIGEDYKNWFISIIPLSAISIFINTNFSLKEIKRSLLMMSLLGILILIVFNYTQYLTHWNSNSICIFSSFAILSIIILYKIEKKFKFKIVYFFLVIISAYMIFLTENRNTMLVFLIAMALIIIMPCKFWNKKKIYIFLLFGFIMTAIIPNTYEYTQNSNIIKNITEELGSVFSKNTLLSGREGFWDYCQELVKDSFMFGHGESLYNYIYAHNMYFSIIYFYGIAGYVLYIVYIFSIIKNINNTDIIRLYCILMFISIIFGQIMENSLFTANSNLFMPYIYLSIALNKKIEGDKENDEIIDCIHTNL